MGYTDESSAMTVTRKNAIKKGPTSDFNPYWCPGKSWKTHPNIFPKFQFSEW